MKMDTNDNILELGKMYKTPWKVVGFFLGSDFDYIDYDRQRVLNDGEYVVILEVDKLYRTLLNGTNVTEYSLKLLLGTGEIVITQVSHAGIDYWKKCKLA